MIDKKKDALSDLVVASLISEAYVLTMNGNDIRELYVPFNKEKSYYLLNYLESNNLQESVIVEPHKEQFKIVLNFDLSELVKSWYQNGIKIFSVKLSSLYLNFQNIITCINLFGERKIESINIRSTIGTEYLRTLTYCIEKLINLDATSGVGQLKFPSVPKLFLGTVYKVSALDSSELANYLTNREKNNLIDVISEKSEQCYA